jgi:hypothetical protein
MINKYKTAANAEKDYDIEWYCVQLLAMITQLQAGVPAWTSAEILQQVHGRLSNIVPSFGS